MGFIKKREFYQDKTGVGAFVGRTFGGFSPNNAIRPRMDTDKPGPAESEIRKPMQAVGKTFADC